MSGELRALKVREIKAHSDDYRGFVIEGDKEEEAEKFLKNGYTSGEIGNCMPLAVSNAKGMPIFIMLSQPVIALSPRKAFVFPILVAFNHHGCGHYICHLYVKIIRVIFEANVALAAMERKALPLTAL